MYVCDKETGWISCFSYVYVSNLRAVVVVSRHGSQFSTHCVRFQHLMFLYVTTQVSYVVIRYVLLLRFGEMIQSDVLSLVLLSQEFVFEISCVFAREKKLRSRPDQTGTLEVMKIPLEEAEMWEIKEGKKKRE